MTRVGVIGASLSRTESLVETLVRFFPLESAGEKYAL